jgi:hypothetical protein
MHVKLSQQNTQPNDAEFGTRKGGFCTSPIVSHKTLVQLNIRDSSFHRLIDEHSPLNQQSSVYSIILSDIDKGKLRTNP